MAGTPRTASERASWNRGPFSALAFLVFLFVPIAVVTVELAVVLCLELVWTDLIHTNLNRSLGNVLAMMALSPIYGLFGALILGGIPILLVATLVSAAVAISGRLTSAAFASVVVLGMGLFICSCYVGSDALSENIDPQHRGPPWWTLVGGPLVLTLSWLGGRSALIHVSAE